MSRTSREHGLTLIEITVASVIGLVVVTLALTWMISVKRGADRADSRASATVAIDHVLERMRQDIGGARAPDRASDAIYDPEDFSRSVQTGAPLRGYDADGVTIRDLDVQDIRLATPTTVVVAAPGNRTVACVRWLVDGGELAREVLASASPGCAGAGGARERRVMLERTGDDRSDVGAPFSYVVAMPVGGGQCTTRTMTSVPESSRGGILAVVVDLQSLVGNTKIEGRSSRGVRIDLDSRRAEAYQRAIGCIP